MVLNVGLVGYGYWGKNHLSTLRDMPEVDVKYVCDGINLPSKRAMPQGAKYTPNYSDLLNDKELDAVILATPTSTHYDLARSALNSGKHVLVEKPITHNVESAVELAEISQKNGKILMVGHTFLYNPAVEYMKAFIDTGELGKLRYIDARRVNPGPIRQDVNSAWDLGSHDISIALHLLNSMPISVGYQGQSFNGHVDDISNLVLKFPDKIIANIHTNWIHPRKERVFIIGGEKKALAFTDTEPANKINVYEMGVDFQPKEGGLGYFQSAIASGDTHIPKIEFKQPLLEELRHFFACISNGIPCRSDALNGINTLRVLEAADKSRKQNGLEVKL